MAKKATRSRAATVMSEINSTLGAPILRLGNDPFFKIVRIPSGSHSIDRITGGGLPLGRHIEFYGDESSCKSYVAYRTMALSQQRGNLCACIDPEHSFDSEWFRHLGGNPDELLMSWPNVAEEAVEAMMLMFKKGVEVIMVDSVASLSTQQEARRAPTEDAVIASQARFMSLNLRRLTSMNERTLVIWTNQFRTKIGRFFGSPTTTPGGRALKFYDTARIEFRRGKHVEVSRKVPNDEKKLVSRKVKVGHWVMVRAEKNKVSRPHLEASFIFDNEKAEIDEFSEIIQLGLYDGIIERTGDTFTYEDYDGLEWAGSEKSFRRLIRENEGLYDELVDTIQEETLDLAAPSKDNHKE